MTTYVRANEAARRLGVTTATLYAYVSRGRIGRITGADGRASLFDLDEVERLRDRSRRQPVAPPPTIDVRISTSITQLSEDGLAYRGQPVDELIDQPYERVAELLWTGVLPASGPVWPTPEVDPPCVPPTIDGLIGLAAGLATPSDHPDDAIDLTRTFLAAIPASCGARTPASRSRHRFADALTRVWVERPSAALVDVVNAALVLLADHELATSTLAVRVAASVRSSPIHAVIAGLATVQGDLHGSASRHVHDLFGSVEVTSPDAVLEELRAAKRRVPGFGHSIYRQRDPRFAPLLDRVRRLPDRRGRMDVVDRFLDAAAGQVAQQPNVDLALGALTYVAGLPADLPIFAVARTAGWTAHYIEELGERPVRFRGLARQA